MTTTSRSDRLVAAVSAICGERHRRRVLPEHALSVEVAHMLGCGIREVEDTAHSLAVDGVIRVGRTMNYEYYELTKQK